MRTVFMVCALVIVLSGCARTQKGIEVPELEPFMFHGEYVPREPSTE